MIRVRVCQWGASEWWATISSLFFSEKKAPERLQRKLENIFQRDVFLFNSGRTAIALCLQFVKSKQQNKSEVIIPSYICTSVIEVVEKNGFDVVRASVDEELNLALSNVESLISDKTAAIIAPHMYSCSANIEGIERLSHNYGVFLIDDAAQVFGVKSHDRLLGTFGQAGILSFAQAKSIVTGIKGSGGALVVNDPELRSFIEMNSRNYPRQQLHLSRIIEFLCVYKWRGIFEKAHYYIGRIKSRLNVSRNYNNYSPRLISYTDAEVAFHQVESFDSRCQFTKDKLKIYRQTLSNLSYLRLVQLSSTERYLSRLIVRIEGVSPDVFSKYLRSEGVDSKKAYLKGSQMYNGQKDTGLLELPLQDISLQDVHDVCRACQSFNSSSSYKSQLGTF